MSTFGDPLRQIWYALSILQPTSLRLKKFYCPVCEPSVLIRLSGSPIGVRCLRCASSAITLSLISVLKERRPGFTAERVYELSSRGPLLDYFGREVTDLTFSEYFDDVLPGEYRNGVQCQDVHNLTYASGSFDICTSTEVFEHVPDDTRGFSELRRVLRPGGALIFTVPLGCTEKTVERAAIRDGKLVCLLPPEYHDDRIRGRGKVLVYRDYGFDICQRLIASGFATAEIDNRYADAFLGYGSPVVVAYA